MGDRFLFFRTVNCNNITKVNQYLNRNQKIWRFGDTRKNRMCSGSEFPIDVEVHGEPAGLPLRVDAGMRRTQRRNIKLFPWHRQKPKRAAWQWHRSNAHVLEDRWLMGSKFSARFLAQLLHSITCKCTSPSRWAAKRQWEKWNSFRLRSGQKARER